MSAWLLAALIALAGLGRGIDEGMTMIQRGDEMFAGPEHGVRGHAWFRWYHLIGVAWIGMSMVFGGAAALVRPGWVAMLGATFAYWEAFELGYCRARNGRWIPEYEHVTIDIIEIRINRELIGLWHVARCAAAVALITIGG